MTEGNIIADFTDKQKWKAVKKLKRWQWITDNIKPTYVFAFFVFFLIVLSTVQSLGLLKFIPSGGLFQGVALLILGMVVFYFFSTFIGATPDLIPMFVMYFLIVVTFFVAILLLKESLLPNFFGKEALQAVASGLQSIITGGG